MNKERMIAFRLTEKDYKQIKKGCKKLDLKISEFCLLSVKKQLNNENKSFRSDTIEEDDRV